LFSGGDRGRLAFVAWREEETSSEPVAVWQNRRFEAGGSFPIRYFGEPRQPKTTSTGDGTGRFRQTQPAGEVLYC
jgi:hypothetical protein